MDTLRLSVSTFGRVFDVTPQPDALTLAELVASLHRFQLRADLAQRQARDLERARAAAAAIRSRTPTGGPIAKRLQRHLDQTGDLDLALADLERDIRREAKQDLRLWAPLRFVEGARREDANVVHASCLVLDFDRLGGPGLPTPESLRDAFSAYFHIVHSTWSHTPAAPKLRLILPLAAPLAPGDYDATWHAMNTLAGGHADPTGRALARAWALPAIASPDAPRLAWSHPGPLFDPVAARLAAAPSPEPPSQATGLSLLRQDKDHVYLPPLDDDPFEGLTPPASPPPAPRAPTSRTPTAPLPTASASPLPPAAPAPSPPPATTPAPPPPPPIPPPLVAAPPTAAPPLAPATPSPDPATTPGPSKLEARLAALEARVAALERVLGDYL